ncbi:MAG: DUF2812 domain-containing protein [Bacteroidales bacterium]|nr:DUF2812 domain-containing protein [Bacteroidales bacterium]
MKTKKFALRWFVDFDKEEKWLNDMSKAGWCFWHTNGVIYRFKACAPGEEIFQIDFDEKKGLSGEDYVAFRNTCGDKFVHQWKSKIYWKRAASSGPFEEEGNVAAKLRLTNKAYNYHIKSLLGLTLIAAIAFLICVPVGKYMLPSGAFSNWLADFGVGLTAGILFSEIVILLPAVNKLKKKMNMLISQLF